MRLIIVALALILECSSFANILFGAQCEKSIIHLINNSHNTIDIAVYNINNHDIIDALKNAKDRGVNIRILTDRTQLFSHASKADVLHNDEHFNIRLHSHDKIMHHKFAIFDNATAIQGSFNWTYAAAHKNSEDCNVFNIESDIKTLNTRFNELWKLNTKEVSECYFNNMDKEKGERVKCN